LLTCLFCICVPVAAAGQSRGRVGYRVHVGRKVVMRVTQTEKTQTLRITGSSNLIISTDMPKHSGSAHSNLIEQIVPAGRDWRLQLPADSTDVVVVTISSAD